MSDGVEEQGGSLSIEEGWKLTHVEPRRRGWSSFTQAAWAAGQLTSALAALEASMPAERWQAEGHPHSHTLVKLFSVEGTALASMCVDVGVDANAVVQGTTQTDDVDSNVDVDDDAAWVSALRASWEPLGAPYLAAFDRVAVLRQSRPRVVSVPLTLHLSPKACCRMRLELGKRFRRGMPSRTFF